MIRSNSDNAVIKRINRILEPKGKKVVANRMGWIAINRRGTFARNYFIVTRTGPSDSFDNLEPLARELGCWFDPFVEACRQAMKSGGAA